MALLVAAGCADGTGDSASSSGAGGASVSGATAGGSGGGDSSSAGGSGSTTATSGPGAGGSASSSDTVTSSSSGPVACSTPGQCPATGTTCLIQACQGGYCEPLKAPAGSPCSDAGGLECDGNGACTTAACGNGVQDGAELAVDCGGGLCPGCPEGTACGAGVDCATEACIDALCAPCGATGQPCCPDDACSVAVDTCVENTGTMWGGTERECNCGVLRSGQILRVNDSRKSCDGRFVFIMQGDGNVVLYQGNTALFSTQTANTGATQAVMQADGNFVVRDANGQPKYDTGTSGSGAFLAVQDDGNLVIYDGGGAVLFASGTSG